MYSFASGHFMLLANITSFSSFALLSYILVCLVQSKFRVHQADTYTYMCSCVHTHFYLHVSIYINKHIHCTSAIAQKKSSAWRIRGTKARKVEGTMLHLRTPKGPKPPCFPSFPGSQARGCRRGAWTQHWGEHGGVRTAEMHCGGGTSTVVWRKRKLLCICLRDPRIAHGCWYATGGHHTGGHA